MTRLKILFVLLSLCPVFFAHAQVIQTIWANDIGSLTGCTVTKMVTDAQDNVYVTGVFQQNVDFALSVLPAKQLTSNGSLDIFVAKYNSAGVLQWYKNIGGAGPDTAVSICLDDNQDIYITGNYQSATIDVQPGTGVILTNKGYNDVFLIKLSNNGNMLWAKAISGPSQEYVGGVKADHNGNVFIGGSFSSPTDFGDGKLVSPTSPVDGFIAKYSGSGTFTWLYHFGGTGALNDVYSLTTDISNNILVTGRSDDIGVSADFVAKYNTNGALIWIDRIARNDIGPNAITSDLLGNIFLAGCFAGKATFNTGTTAGTLTAIGNTDGFVAKYDTNGIFLWAKNFGDTNGSTEPLDITTDSKSNAYICGWFNSNIPDFNATGNLVLTPFSGNNIFAAKYTGAGVCAWATNAGAVNFTLTSADAANSLGITSTGDLLLAGLFNQRPNFNPNPNCISSVPFYSATVNGYIARYGITPVPVITGFTLSQQKNPAVIDTINRTINIQVVTGTDISKLSPTVTVSNSGVLTPASGTVQNFTTPFTYQVSVGCYTYNYLVTVTIAPPITAANAGSDQSACNTSTFTLQANAPKNTETGTWSVVSPPGYSPFDLTNINNPNAQIKNVPADTKVILSWTITLNGNQQTSADSVILWNYSAPVIGGNKNLIINNTGGSVTINPSITGGGTLSYMWRPGKNLNDSTIANPIASPSQNTAYTLTVTNSKGCSSSAIFNVLVINALNVPSVFTPNNDGINDVWAIKNIEGYPNCEVSVYNRNGQLLFYSKGYPFPWDGTYKGKKLPEGAYYYVLKANDSKNETLSGTVTLMY